jgi:hypothetical protein
MHVSVYQKGLTAYKKPVFKVFAMSKKMLVFCGTVGTSLTIFHNRLLSLATLYEVLIICSS